MISVVIPIYKAEGCLQELYRRLKVSLETITSDFEIIFVEDCGGDRSWEIIEALSKQDPRIKGFQFSRNFGQHCGITAGLDRCNGDWIVVMDGDLQDQPEEIPRLYTKAQEGFDVVRARRGKRQDALLKRLTSRLFYGAFSYLADVDYDSEVGNFRIVSRKVVDSFRRMREQVRLFSVMVDWMGFPTASIEVAHAARAEGKSTYTYRKLFQLATGVIIYNSDKPLRLFVLLGFSIAGFSFLFGLYLIGWALLKGSTVTGWSSLIVSVYFLGGIIIALLGVLGVYLGKTFDETKGRPLYIIRRSTRDIEQE